jgi:hypothetical protein
MVALGLFRLKFWGGIFYLQMAGYIVLIASLIYLLILTVRLLIKGHPNPSRQIAAELTDIFLTKLRLVHILNVFFISFFTINIFSSYKSSIPSLSPFSWDNVFLNMDRSILGGLDAYHLTSIIFGSDYSLIFINFFYNLWLIVVVAAIVWCGFIRDSLLRIRYLIAMWLSWVIAGNVLAVAFSSVGPCFVQRLNGETSFAPLMAMLHDANDRTGAIWALSAQDLLWRSYVSNGGLISGISAMPSLHVVFAVLLFLATRKLHKAIAAITFVFAAIILVGSVQLGWHYLVDGLAGIVLAVVFWKIAKPLAELSLRKAQTPAMSAH